MTIIGQTTLKCGGYVIQEEKSNILGYLFNKEVPTEELTLAKVECILRHGHSQKMETACVSSVLLLVQHGRTSEECAKIIIDLLVELEQRGIRLDIKCNFEHPQAWTTYTNKLRNLFNIEIHDTLLLSLLMESNSLTAFFLRYLPVAPIFILMVDNLTQIQVERWISWLLRLGCDQGGPQIESLRKFFEERYPQLVPELNNTLSCPFSLQVKARIAIRKSIAETLDGDESFTKAVDCLPLPKDLKDYLLFI